jgi:hypothetical protein
MTISETVQAVRDARALMDHVSLVLKYRLETEKARLYLRRFSWSGRYIPARERDVARFAAGGDLDRVWAARRDEQCGRNDTRAKAWRARYDAFTWATDQ